MLQSLFFPFSWVIAVVSLLFLVRTKTKFVWLPIVLVGGAAAVFACISVLSAFGVRYSIVENAVLNCILASAAFFINSRKEKEETAVAFADRGDLVALIVTAFIAVGCAYAQFGFPFGINFSTSDPANHLYASLEIVNGGDVNGQFFTHLLCACSILVFEPLVGTASSYVVFIAVEVFLLWLAGLSFYSMLMFCLPKHAIVSVVLTALFMLGYPLNNLVFGFSYLGAGVTVVTLCLAVAPMLANKDRGRNSWFLLPLLLYALMITYTLFVPTVYFALFLYVMIIRAKQEIPIRKILIEEAKLFVFPVLMGLLFSYIPMFAGGSPSGAIAVEGYIFRDLYSSFVFIAPLFVYGIYCEFKKEGCSFCVILLVCMVVFALALLLGGAFGKVSSYYFFKCHYLLWMLLFAFVAVGAVEALSKSPKFLFSYTLVYVFLFVIFFTGLDQKFSAARPLFNPSPASSSFVPFVYRFNLEQIESSAISDDVIDLIAQSEILGADGNKVAVLGDDSISYWFRALTLQEQDGYWWQTTLYDQKGILDGAEYVLVLNYEGSLTLGSGENYSSIRDYAYSLGEVCYGNEKGAIIKIR